MIFKIILGGIVFTRDFWAGRSGFKNDEYFILLSSAACQLPGQSCPGRWGGQAFPPVVFLSFSLLSDVSDKLLQLHLSPLRPGQVQRSDWGWRRRPAWSQVEPGCARSVCVVWLTVCLAVQSMCCWWWTDCRHWALVGQEILSDNLNFGGHHCTALGLEWEWKWVCPLSYCDIIRTSPVEQTRADRGEAEQINSFQLNLSCKFWLRV